MIHPDRIGSASREGSGFTSQRRRGRMVSGLRASGIDNVEVLEAMRRVPRHLFVDEAISTRSYDDHALPIGCGQTISQPYIVAQMTSLLLGGQDGRKPERVLELGTGSGYQAAVLSLLVKRIYTVECIEELHERSSAILSGLGYDNIRCQIARSGEWGWPLHAPYDAVIITAATEKIPEALFEQLAPGGIIVAPVGPIEGSQVLQVHHLSPKGDGSRQVSEYEPVRFVPLVS